MKNIIKELIDVGLIIQKEGKTYISNGKAAYWLKKEESIPYILKLKEETNFLPRDSSFKERIFCLLNYIDSNFLECEICHKNKKIFKGFQKGYSRYCSVSCRNNDKENYKKRIEKIAETRIKMFESGELQVWNKGLTKEDKRVKKYAESGSLTKARRKKEGKYDHLKKRKPLSSEAKKKISNAQKENYKKLFSKPGERERYRKKKKLEMQKFIKENPEWIDKVRAQSVQNRINKNNSYPNYSKKSCIFFRILDKSLDFNGQYAENKVEYHIKELGYFLDYIELNKKIIIEWDEEKHYLDNGELKKPDVERQEKIQKFFPEFRFLRIKDFNVENLFKVKETINYIAEQTSTVEAMFEQ